MLWLALDRWPGKILSTSYELIGRGFTAGSEPEQSLERRHRLLAPVVAKNELVQINLKLSRTDAVMGSDQPLLQITDCAVCQRHDRFRALTKFNRLRLAAWHVSETSFL